MNETYKIRLIEYARVTQKLLCSVLSSEELLTENAQICVESALLLSSFALEEQRERADTEIVVFSAVYLRCMKRLCPRTTAGTVL